MSERTHAYCPRCRQESAIDRNARCLWCGGDTVERPKRGGWKRPDLRGSKYTEAQLRAMHVAHRRGASMNQLAGRTYRLVGYASRNSACSAISREWKRMGLPALGRIESCVRASTTHGRKRRKQTNAEQNAYRRWLRDKRGWLSINGPGRPQCAAVKKHHPGKGEPCQRPALEDSEFCQSHDPRRELARQAHLARSRARQPKREMVPLAPFAEWLRRRSAELGSLNAVATHLGVGAQIYRWARCQGHGPDRNLIGADIVRQALEADGSTSLEGLYPKAMAA